MLTRYQAAQLADDDPLRADAARLLKQAQGK
jgi:hypothetical protein